ncbi:MAG: helix-turn-helix transcriptional regulator [Clostridia bacterium]|nr:helix-turn-helix transcriptional regulator [Clostridia bacterium]
MSDLNKRLQQLKIERNLLQKDIAASIDLSLRSYQRYESGEREPTTDILIALADYFNVSIDYLVGRSDNPNSHKC